MKAVWRGPFRKQPRCIIVSEYGQNSAAGSGSKCDVPTHSSSFITGTPQSWHGVKPNSTIATAVAQPRTSRGSSSSPNKYLTLLCRSVYDLPQPPDNPTPDQ